VVRENGRLTLGVDAYYSDVRDYIDRTVVFVDPTIPPSFVPGVGTVFCGTTSSRNVDAELWGFEAKARYDAGFRCAGIARMVPRGEDADGGPLGAIPADRVNLTLGLRPLDGVDLGVRATFADAMIRFARGRNAVTGFEG
jgi:hemoglobin/transferrin/lactoferrin receptor protein